MLNRSLNEDEKKELFNRMNFVKYQGKKDFVNAIDNICNYVEQNEKEMEYCRKSVEEAEKKIKEWNKDDEIAKLEKENEELKKLLIQSFVINDEEQLEIDKWCKKHLDKKHSYKDPLDNKRRHKSFGAIGGNFTYIFTPTSIGTIGTIKCSCGEEFDFKKL